MIRHNFFISLHCTDCTKNKDIYMLQKVGWRQQGRRVLPDNLRSANSHKHLGWLRFQDQPITSIHLSGCLLTHSLCWFPGGIAPWCRTRRWWVGCSTTSFTFSHQLCSSTTMHPVRSKFQCYSCSQYFSRIGHGIRPCHLRSMRNFEGWLRGRWRWPADLGGYENG